MKKYYLFITLLMLLALTTTSCKKGGKNMKTYAQIELSTNEFINLELYPEVAPKTVENFVNLANKGYYEGTIFHRVIRDFMIQTGGYYLEDNTLYELPSTPSIKGEFSSNGFKNDLKHELGVISMARTSDPNSATGQFFICSTTYPSLDGQYAAFGKTTDDASNKVILRISYLQTINIGYGLTNFLADDIKIVKVRIANEKF